MITPKEFFVSYAHEDAQIANALAATLRQIDNTFVVVNIDKVSLETGVNFRTQLQEQLQRSEVLFVVHSNVTKSAFSYPGWEVGYFEGVHGNDDSKIISLYLSGPPDTTSERQGIGLNITTDDLRLAIAEFKSRLDEEVTQAHPLVRFIDEKRMELAIARRDARLPPSVEVDAVQSVRDMLLSIYIDRKNGADTTIKPQKQITIRTHRDSLQNSDGDLPGSAEVVPVGAGAPMSVFGLAERPILWADFCTLADRHTLGKTWADAIRSVIVSASPHQINVDNSQIVLSPDNHIYRLILTTSTTYFNGEMEVNLYLVEAMRRSDHGDPITTRLLKGIELASRFRFLFLERDSRFYANNLKLLRIDSIRAAARELLSELNLLQRDALDAGLHEPAIWGGLVSWELLEALGREWRPVEPQLRSICAEVVRASSDQETEKVRNHLAEVIQQLETAIRPLNTRLIVEMAGSLQKVVETSDENMPKNSAAAATASSRG